MPRVRRRKETTLPAPDPEKFYTATTGFHGAISSNPGFTVREGQVLPGSHEAVRRWPIYFVEAGTSDAELRRIKQERAAPLPAPKDVPVATIPATLTPDHPHAWVVVKPVREFGGGAGVVLEVGQLIDDRSPIFALYRKGGHFKRPSEVG